MLEPAQGFHDLTMDMLFAPSLPIAPAPCKGKNKDIRLLKASYRRCDW
ncbi:hypothetical protein GbCGDNIH2_1529 [Granulibacter bethesdensis]|uniref:Uncharacterized protein n=1 Tax=Granulibacter bethesdensis (strain ATCC BAA-1260 / CGDNIH1) TaxID=391165 RepID=Q0BRX5_GRABC|nr:hypothetical protein GbCGDNIH1_1529 [Granulibacter bethesdensis CGDNIH1]APG30692.1 hypothetical protein GbCGDNIH2_1529 [Granulibacter bethesdensis]APH52264.1 hypothetical protein GbCGDNIH5_1529 [Granulibacter bethesdensis]APH64957.1 hypothetical protein GbCGDNIH1I4_1529 [Granulibacter bethesdensis]